MKTKRLLAIFLVIMMMSTLAASLSVSADGETYHTLFEQGMFRKTQGFSIERAVEQLRTDDIFIAGHYVDQIAADYSFNTGDMDYDGLRFRWVNACQVSTADAYSNYKYTVVFRSHLGFGEAGISIRDNTLIKCDEYSTNNKVIGKSKQGIVLMMNPGGGASKVAMAIRKSGDQDNTTYIETSKEAGWFSNHSRMVIEDKGNEIIYSTIRLEKENGVENESEAVKFDKMETDNELIPFIKVTLNSATVATSGTVFEWNGSSWNEIGTFDGADIPEKGMISLMAHGNPVDLGYLKLQVTDKALIQARDEYKTVFNEKLYRKHENTLYIGFNKDDAVNRLQKGGIFVGGNASNSLSETYDFDNDDANSYDGLRLNDAKTKQITTREAYSNYKFTTVIRTHYAGLFQWAGISIRDTATDLCSSTSTKVSSETNDPNTDLVIGKSTHGIVFMTNTANQNDHNFAVAIRKADDAENAMYFRTSKPQSYFTSSTRIEIEDKGNEIIFSTSKNIEPETAPATPLVKIVLNDSTSGEVFEFINGVETSLGTFEGADILEKGRINIVTNNNPMDLGFFKLETSNVTELIAKIKEAEGLSESNYIYGWANLESTLAAGRELAGGPYTLQDVADADAAINNAVAGLVLHYQTKAVAFDSFDKTAWGEGNLVGDKAILAFTAGGNYTVNLSVKVDKSLGRSTIVLKNETGDIVETKKIDCFFVTSSWVNVTFIVPSAGKYTLEITADGHNYSEIADVQFKEGLGATTAGNTINFDGVVLNRGEI